MMDGGQAFPTYSPEVGAQGMSLRDWLAGQALAGMLANQERLKIIVNHEDTQAEADRKIAIQAYRHADAMIAARTDGGDDD